MTYELAKELKDAGFQFDFGGVISMDMEPPIKNFQKYPTISELIESCGPGEFRLYRLSDGHWVADWIATGQNGHGDTSEEAVARLWLALQETNKPDPEMYAHSVESAIGCLYN